MRAVVWHSRVGDEHQLAAPRRTPREASHPTRPPPDAFQRRELQPRNGTRGGRIPGLVRIHQRRGGGAALLGAAAQDDGGSDAAQRSCRRESEPAVGAGDDDGQASLGSQAVGQCLGSEHVPLEHAGEHGDREREDGQRRAVVV